MKRLLLLYSLSVCIAPSHAQGHWLRLGEDATAEIYIDAVHTVQSPTYIKAWTLLSFNNATDGGWRSEKRLLLYSCKDKSLAWQQSIFYSGPMGEGEFVDVRSLSKHASAGPAKPASAAASNDRRSLSEAVPEAAFIDTFRSLC